jgi:hypothetical protein
MCFVGPNLLEFTYNSHTKASGVKACMQTKLMYECIHFNHLKLHKHPDTSQDSACPLAVTHINLTPSVAMFHIQNSLILAVSYVT